MVNMDSAIFIGRIKDCDPHKLHPDIEKRIEQFISTLSLI